MVLKNNLQNHKVILPSYRSFFLLVFGFNYIPTCSIPLPGLPPPSHKHICTNDVHNILKGPRGALQIVGLILSLKPLPVQLCGSVTSKLSQMSGCVT